MRVGLLSAWASRSGGGVFEAVVGQALLLRDRGIAPMVFGLEDEHSTADRERFDGIPVQVLPTRGPNALGYAPGLLPALLSADLDVLHLHGIWMYPSAAGARWARATGRPYLVSPHGMLDPWITARGRWKKAIARIGYERQSWRQAHRLHALTEAETCDIARESGRRDSVIVPNPVPLPRPDPEPQEKPGPYVLALGRVHPKKNLSGLVEGWRASDAARSGWQLVIAGWGEPDHVAALKTQLASASDPSVRFVGPVFGEEKAALLSGARFLALPSHSEGLPMAILEAWAAGTPTLMSKGCNLPEGIAAGAALDMPTNASGIAGVLERALALDPTEHRAMAKAARALAEARFAPAVIADRWEDIYRTAIAEHRSA